MKRIVKACTFFITTMILLIMLCAGNSYLVKAEDNLTVKVSQATGVPSDTVKVLVSISGNSGVAGIQMKIKYNNSYLTATKAVANKSNINADGMSVLVNSDAYIGSQRAVSVVFATIEDTNATGKLATISFNINSKTKLSKLSTGSKVIPVTVEEVMAIKADGTEVSVTKVNGGVTIKCPHTKTNIVNTATCTKAGVITESCSNCGEVVNSYESTALGHDYKQAEYVEPTVKGDGYINSKCSLCGKTKTKVIPRLKAGLAMESDGTWSYYKDGEAQTGYTGLVYDNIVGWWYVENGKINFWYTGLAFGENVGWWYVENGTINFDYSGLGYNDEVGWWYVKKGSVDYRTGLVYDDKYGWWYIEGGNVDFTRTGLVYDDYLGWWFVSGGSIDFTRNGLVYDDYVGWWYVENGFINLNYTGLAFNEYAGWWYVENAAINYEYTGFVNHNDGSFWVQNGCVIFG